MDEITTPFGLVLVDRDIFTASRVIELEDKVITFANIETAYEYGVSNAALYSRAVGRMMDHTGAYKYSTSVSLLWDYGFWGDSKQLAGLLWLYDLPLGASSKKVTFKDIMSMRVHDVDEWGLDSDYL